MNTRVVVTKYGGAEVLEVIAEPFRKLRAGEIRVKVDSAGVALADVMRREGVYPASPTPPFTPGYDVVGIVEELGEGVQGVALGEKVAVFYHGVGGYASNVYAMANEVVPVPIDLDSVASVALVLNYVTAWQMLHRIAKVAEGETILIHGAAGGVGTALLELGKLAGLRMFGTASAGKHATLTQFGAVPIDYQAVDFVEALRQQAPDGVDAVFDPIGGEHWQQSFQTLSTGGRFVGYGYTSIFERKDPNDWARDWKKLADTGHTDRDNPVFTYSVTGLRTERPEWFQEDLRHLFRLLADGRVHPIISHRIPLRAAARAHELLEKSQFVGKIVLIPE